MDALRTIFSGPWHTPLGAAIALGGLAILGHGLFGPYGLLRRRITLLARLEGWRLSVFGLAVIGLGAAWLWESRLFLVLSLTIAFTEMQEATKVIDVMKTEERRRAKSSA